MSKTESWKTWEGRSVGGKFPLRQWLGSSDHSAVFLTERPGLAKAAIKLIAVEPAEAEQVVTRIHTTSRLSHPNLIRTFEAGRAQIEGAAFIYVVMEFAEEDLSQILPQRALTPEEVSDLLPPLLGAVSYLHSKGFVHSRIKPSNVLAVGNQLKLSADQITSLTETSPARRRDVYDAPESAAGILSPASDVWSVGVTLVAAITQNVALAEQTSHKNPSLPETIAEPYRGIARDCLQLDPKRRSSLQQIQARLQPAGLPVAARPEPAPATPRGPEPERRPLNRWPILIPVAVLLALFFGWIIFRGNSTPKTSDNVQPVQQQNQDTAQQTTAESKPSPAPEAPARKPPEAARRASVSAGNVKRQVIPDIPKSAKNTIRGTINISVHVDVDPSGRVVAAKLKNAGPSRYFAEKTLKAAEKWEFSPQPATTAWLLHFRLRRTSIDASPEMLNR